MSYSGLAKSALLSVGLSVALSACAHSSPSQSASRQSPTTVETAGSRDTDGPRATRLRSAFLAGEAHPHQMTSGDVVVEQVQCDVWASDASDRCNLETLVDRSMAPGYQRPH